MRKYFWAVLVWFITAFALSSCANPADGGADARVRVSVESTGTVAADIRLYLEGPSGDSVSGAVVQVIDSVNSVQNLSYDANYCCYKTSKTVLPDGLLTFRVYSVLLSEPYKLTLSHIQLSAKPAISVFQDASGNSVLSGQTLDRTKQIQLAWSALGSGILYTVSLRTAASVYYAASTEASALTIPANILPAGSAYYASVSAQRISGDPYFVSENYYSVSSSGSTNVYFSVE